MIYNALSIKHKTHFSKDEYQTNGFKAEANCVAAVQCLTAPENLEPY